MSDYSFTSSGAATYDLTDTGTVNTDAAALATAREGGFTMRNRINWGNVTAPTLTNGAMNVLKILRIPPRTVMEDLFLICPRGASATTHAIGISAVASKTVSSGVAEIGFIAWKSANGSTTSTVVGGFAQTEVLKSKMHGSGTASELALPLAAASSPKGSIRNVVTGVAGNQHGWDDGGDDAAGGMHFPFGGYVTFQLSGGIGKSAGSAASWDGAFSGTTEVVARGWKVPE